MSSLPTLPDLAVPAEAIIRQANGQPLEQLRLAAAWGYNLACRDLEQVAILTRSSEEVQP